MVVLLQKNLQNNKLSIRVTLLLCFCFLTGYTQIDTPEDCPDAYRICDATQNYFFEVNGVGAIDDAYGANNVYCVYQDGWTLWEHNSAWFIFTPQYSGQFGFLICPESSTQNWDWALFENPDCTNLNNSATWFRCITNQPIAVVNGCTGIGILNGYGNGPSGLDPFAYVTAGNTYILYAVFPNLPYSDPGRATLSFQGQVVQDHPDLFNYSGCTMGNSYFVENQTKVYPTPLNNVLQIESSESYKNLSIYDLTGKQILNQEFMNKVDISNLTKGFYFLYLQREDGKITVKKIMKE